MKNLTVRSTSIDWQDQTMEIVDTSGNKHDIPLDKAIHVTMIGYPKREEKDMLARDLGPYMIKGYMIEQISFEEKQP